VRATDNIPGDGITDCCVMAFCGCCALIQELNHLDARAAEKASANVTVLVTAPQQMVMGAAPQMMMPAPAYGYAQQPQAYGAPQGYPQQGYPQQGYPPQQPGYPPQQGGAVYRTY
jgi:hypothetical protein